MMRNSPDNSQKRQVQPMYYWSWVNIFNDKFLQVLFIEEWEDWEPEQIEIECNFTYEWYETIANFATIQLIETDQLAFILWIDKDCIILNWDIEYYDLSDQLNKITIVLSALEKLNQIVNEKVVGSIEAETTIKSKKEIQWKFWRIIDNISFNVSQKRTIIDKKEILKWYINLSSRIITQLENALEYYRELEYDDNDEEKQIFISFYKKVTEILFIFKNINTRLTKNLEIINNLLEIYKL